jgi:DNA-binding NtrC family response regulator
MVEDDLLIRGVNTAILIFSGYAMAAGECGAAAWDALKLKRYDLMVTDHEMLKASGVELLKKVHAIRPRKQ